MDIQTIERGAAMRVSKWGNSLAVRLPASAARRLNLKAGDEIEFEPATNGTVRIAVTTRRKQKLEKLKEFSSQYPMPEDFRFDREDIHAR